MGRWETKVKTSASGWHKKETGSTSFSGCFEEIPSTSTSSNDRKKKEQGQRKQPLRQIAEYTHSALTQHPDGV
jgi:hypothetical protein